MGMFLAHFHHWNVPKCPPRSYQPCLQYRHHGIQGWTRWRKGYLLRRGWLALLKLLICRGCMSFTCNIPIVKENSRHTNSISKISFEFWGLQHACAISSKLSSILVLAIYFYVRRVALSETWPTHSRHRTSCVVRMALFSAFNVKIFEALES